VQVHLRSTGLWVRAVLPVDDQDAERSVKIQRATPDD
jgi:hypothetical protein